MQECFQKYPEIYSKYADDDEGEERSDGESTEPSQESGSTVDSSSEPPQQSIQAETS